MRKLPGDACEAWDHLYEEESGDSAASIGVLMTDCQAVNCAAAWRCSTGHHVCVEAAGHLESVGDVKAFRVSSLSFSAKLRRISMTIGLSSSENSSRWKNRTEKEDKSEEKRSNEHEHVDGMKDSLLEPRCGVQS